MVARETTTLEERHCPLWSTADISQCKRHVRFTPESGHVRCNQGCPLWAKSGLMQRSNLDRYSINSLASDWNDAGTVNPSFLAVVRLMMNSNLLGRSIGSSLGLAPLRMRPT